MATKKTETKKTTKKEDTSKKKETFDFGNVKKEDKKLSREERRALVEDLIGPTPTENRTKFEWMVEETEYVPKEFVVVLTPKGLIYQEPVPRYFDYQNFVAILASLPDKPIMNSTKIDFDADYYYTFFDVKNVECNIVTCASNGSRSDNSYDKPFNIKNGTTHIGGNIVFAGPNKPFTKKEANEVVKQIIKTLKSYEEVIECK